MPRFNIVKRKMFDWRHENKSEEKNQLFKRYLKNEKQHQSSQHSYEKFVLLTLWFDR